MKLEKPQNENYAAVVVKLTTINQLEGCDNVVGTPVFGLQAIVGKDTKVGDIGIVFPAETQLSLEFAAKNNLHRHNNLNSDESAKGYLEDNRRVKAMKFRGHKSNALFMPLESLNYIKGMDNTNLAVGTTFDKIGDHEICKKYVRPVSGTPRVEKNKAKVFRRVDEKFLPEHYDSDNYWRNSGAIKPEQRITVTQKLHGTSIRIGHTIVKRKLSLLERLAQKLGVRVAETEFDHVYGSRKVIKDINNPNQDHFYGSDIWTEEGKKLDDLVPENFIIYGELIGYTGGGLPIQKNYTYNIPEGKAELYVYRVAVVNGQGRIVDLSWEQVKEFCNDVGLKHVPQLWSGEHQHFQVDDWIDRRFHDTGFVDALMLERGKESLVDEGVCVRVDGLAPYILKAKSPLFLEHETKMLDSDAVDLEVEGSTNETVNA